MQSIVRTVVVSLLVLLAGRVTGSSVSHAQPSTPNDARSATASPPVPPTPAAPGTRLAGGAIIPPSPPSPAPGGQSITVTGTLSVVYGDQENLYIVTDPANPANRTAVSIDDAVARAAGGIVRLQKKRVTIVGLPATTTYDGAPTIIASSVQPAAFQALTAPAATGPQAFAVLLCQFPDQTTVQHDRTFYTSLMGTSAGALDNYFQDASYGAISLSGSTVGSDWKALPHNMSYYGDGTNTIANLKLHELAQDCVNLFSGEINYSGYIGVQIVTNGAVFLTAWGGTDFLSLSGTTRLVGVTWFNRQYSEYATVWEHEMGHAFGLAHSGSDTGAEYMDAYDVMGYGYYFAPSGQPYVYWGEHTIAQHKDQLGWIPAARKYTYSGGTQTITIDRLGTSSTTNYLLAKIPISGSSTHYYTVESRLKMGSYENQLPVSAGSGAVIIHEVDENRGVPAWVQGNLAGGSGNFTSAAAYQWTAGETFNATLANVTIAVNSATTNGFSVTVAPGTGCPTDAYETNDTLAQAAQISTGTTYTGYICPSGDEDWFKFAASSGTVYTVTLTTLPADFDLYLTDSGGSVLASSVTAGTANESLTYTPTTNGTLYVHVTGHAGAQNNTQGYTLRVSVPGSVTTGSVWTSDGGTDFNVHKTSFLTGDPIRYVARVTNTTGTAQDVRLVWDAVGPGGSILHNINDPISTPNGTVLWGLNTTVPVPPDGSAAPLLPVQPGSTELVATLPRSAQPGTYTLTFSVIYNAQTSTQTSTFTINPTCTADTFETNDTLAQAALISTNTNYTGYVCPSGDEDWFKFAATTGALYTVTLTTLPADYNLYLTDGNGVVFASSVNSSTTSESLTYTATATGTLYVHVNGAAGALSATQVYTLRVAQTPADFSLSCTPSSLTVTRGSSGAGTCTVQSSSGFAAAVALTCPGAPSGVTCAFNPASLTPPANGTATSTLTVNVGGAAATGPVTLAIRGTSGALSHDAGLSLTVTVPPDFSLSCLPATLTVTRGSSGGGICTVQSSGGFTGAVALTCPSVLSGVTCSFNPGSATPPAGGQVTSTLTVNVASNAATGTVTLTVHGASGALSHDAGVSLTVAVAPDFSLSCAPGSLTIAQGTASTSTCTVQSSGGFAGAVALSCPGAPTGVTCAFNPSAPTAPAGGAVNSTATISVSVAAATGTVSLTVQGVNGALTHTATLQLAVQAPPDFSLSCAPASLTVVQGTAGTSTCTVQSSNAFTSAVSLSCVSPPAGVTCAFNPASLTPPANGTATSTLTVNVGGAAATGPVTLTVRGTSGALTHDVGMGLTVIAPPDFAINCTPASLSIVLGSSGASNCTIASTGGFSGAVTLSCPSLAAAVTCAYAPSPITPPAGGTVGSTLTVSVAAGGGIGTFPLTARATSGALTHDATIQVTTTAAPDFGLSCTPLSLSIVQSSSGSATCTVTSQNGFVAAVTLSCPGAPAGITCSFAPAAPAPVAGGQAAGTLTITAAAGAATGTSTLTVRGSSSALSHDASISLVISAAPDFSLSCSPAGVTVAQGASATTTCTTTVIGGSPGTVALSCPTGAAGITCAFNPAAPAAGAGSTLTIAASGSAATGTTPLAVRGTSGAMTHDATISLTIITIGASNILRITPASAGVSSAGSPAPSRAVGVAAAGSPTTVTLEAVPPAARLGSWNVEVRYDPAVVTLITCAGQSGSQCNSGFANNVRVTGFDATGLSAISPLAQLTFQAAAGAAAGAVSPLTITITSYTDPGGNNLPAPTIQNGTVQVHGGVALDVDHDGSVTIVDALCIARYVAGLSSTAACPSPLSSPDVNSDGQETIVDALCIARYVAGLPRTAACPIDPPAAAPVSAPAPAVSAGRSPAAGTSGQSSGSGTAGNAAVRLDPGTLSLAAGAQGVVNVRVSGDARGGAKVGGWSIDVTYDRAVVKVVGCTAAMGVCNTTYAPGVVRLAGTSTAGLDPDATLAQIVFQAVGPARTASALALRVGSLTTPSGALLAASTADGRVSIQR